jgi:hypothetical protein
VEPKTREAEQWLKSNFKQLDKAFTRLHRWDPVDSANADHPHGIYFTKGTYVESEFGFIEVPCHWNQTHAERTVGNLRMALDELGAKLSEFEIGHTG